MRALPGTPDAHIAHIRCPSIPQTQLSSSWTGFVAKRREISPFLHLRGFHNHTWPDFLGSTQKNHKIRDHHLLERPKRLLMVFRSKADMEFFGHLCPKNHFYAAFRRILVSAAILSKKITTAARFFRFPHWGETRILVLNSLSFTVFYSSTVVFFDHTFDSTNAV